MKQTKRKQKSKLRCFTLLEMMVVLIIMGILLTMTIYVSGEQIQKLKNKTVKESIQSEWQFRYSKNLGSSSYIGTMYKYMDISLTAGSNTITFDYTPRKDEDPISEQFSNKFIIKNIVNSSNNNEQYDNITLRYQPYQFDCKIGIKDESKNEINTLDKKSNLILITNVNNNKDYCFEIQQKNCRLIELSDTSCQYLEKDMNLLP